MATFDFPDHRRDVELVALSRPDEYAVLDGRLVSSGGLDFPASAFDEHIEEEHVEHSTALHARLVDRGEYMVGPLARLALNFDRLAPVAQEAAQAVGWGRSAGTRSSPSSSGRWRSSTPVTRRSASSMATRCPTGRRWRSNPSPRWATA